MSQATAREPTVPFAMIPAAILTDGRVASCPPLSRLLFHEMYLRAVLGPGRDRIPLQPGLPYATQVRFLVGDDTERLDKLIAAGAVALERDCLRIVLTVAALNAEARQRAAEARETEGTDFAASQEPEGPEDAAPTRGKPSASKAARRFRHDAEGHPDRKAWVAWLQTAEGRNFTSRREVAYPGYSQWVARAIRGDGTGGGAKGGNGGARHGTQGGTGGGTPSETNVSSENSEDREREEGEGGTVGGTPNVPHKEVPPPSQSATPLEVFRDAAGPHASLVGALELDLNEQLKRRGLPIETLRAMGAACKEVATWWRGNKRPNLVTLTDLAGYYGERGHEWKALDWLLAYAAKPCAPADDEAARERQRAKTAAWVRAQEEQKKKRAAHRAAVEQQEQQEHTVP